MILPATKAAPTFNVVELLALFEPNTMSPVDVAVEFSVIVLLKVVELLIAAPPSEKYMLPVSVMFTITGPKNVALALAAVLPLSTNIPPAVVEVKVVVP